MLFATRRNARSLRQPDMPVGMHLGADGVRMLQLREGPGRSLEIGAAVWLPLPATEGEGRPEASRYRAAAAAVGRALRGRGFVGRRLNAALPAELLQVRTFRSDSAPIFGAAPPSPGPGDRPRASAGVSPGQSMQVQTLLAGEVRQGGATRFEMLSFTASESDVCAFVEPLAATGARIESLCAEPFALYRCAASSTAGSRAGAHAVVHVSPRETQVVIGQGSTVQLVRRVDVGTGELDQAVARRLSVAPDEARRLRARAGESAAAPDADRLGRALFDATRALLEEVARETAVCLRYHAVSFRSAPPQCVRLLGAGAADPFLPSLLKAATGRAVDNATVLGTIATGVTTAPAHCGPEWAVALGLALKPAAADRWASPASAPEAIHA